MNYFKKIMNIISPRARAENGYGMSREARDNALDILDKHGVAAHFYLAASGARDNDELSRALDYLSSCGFIMIKDNSLVGRVAKARLSGDEKATQRRAEFKLINNDTKERKPIAMNEKELAIARLNINEYHEMSDDKIVTLAKKGNLVAYDVLQVRKHNNSFKNGDTVIYHKSAVEGNVLLKISGKARLLDGSKYPVVSLEFIGDVFLDKIEPYSNADKTIKAKLKAWWMNI